jgi:hypothetical protein
LETALVLLQTQEFRDLELLGNEYQLPKEYQKVHSKVKLCLISQTQIISISANILQTPPAAISAIYFIGIFTTIFIK